MQGSFYFRKEESPHIKHIFLLAGGVGVTPLLSMIRYIHEDVSEIGASLLYSSKRSEDFVMLEELHQLSKQRFINDLQTDNEVKNSTAILPKLETKNKKIQIFVLVE